LKLFLPKQHGAWAMVLIPFWLGAAASGVVWQHIPFFVGWILLYLATYPMLLLFKGKKRSFYYKWVMIYIIPALFLLMAPLLKTPSIVFFGLVMLPFFVVNAYFSSKNKDRALVNDFSAIITFGIAGLASSYLSTASINIEAVMVFVASVLFFVGSTFYVKTMVREKKNIRFKYISWSYHVIVPIVWGVTGQWLVALAFIPSLVRAIVFYGHPIEMLKLGVYEIVNAGLFFLIILFIII